MKRLTGGLGDDVLTGGNGKDTFIYSFTANEGHDVILGFTKGKGADTLQISGLLDVNDNDKLNIADFDAGGHSITGSADGVVITLRERHDDHAAGLRWHRRGLLATW